MRWSRPCGHGRVERDSSITWTVGLNICRFGTLNDSLRPVQNRPSVLSGIPMTTHWPRPSSGCSRRNLFIHEVHGGTLTTWSTRRWNGSMGSTTDGCFNRSATSRWRRWSRRTIANFRSQPERPDSNSEFSGKPGVIHSECGETLRCPKCATFDFLNCLLVQEC